MKKRELMTMAFSNHPLLGETSLTDVQRNVLTVVQGCPSMKASMLSEALNISMRRCSAILKILFDKGYLTRKKDPHSENGIIYIYLMDTNRWGK